MKIRAVGQERLLGVPRRLAKKLDTEYMDVSMDNSGRLIYAPIQGGGA
jgi:hypothetical protein